MPQARPIRRSLLATTALVVGVVFLAAGVWGVVGYVQADCDQGCYETVGLVIGLPLLLAGFGLVLLGRRLRQPPG